MVREGVGVGDGHEPGIGDEEYWFLNWVLGESGLELVNYQLRTLRRRVPACLRAVRASSLSEARRVMAARPELRARALSTLVIGVTSFFRDAAVFRALREELLPPLLAGRAGVGAWCVGCSDGSELYSLAMLLDELGYEGRWHLLGTDCRGDAVRRAREGVYDGQGLRGLDEALLERYFVREAADQWRVKPELRSSVHWRKADALSVDEPGAWDVILCRNMGMYLVPEAAAGLWRRLEAALRPGGLLVLGKAERPNGARDLAAIGPCIYRRGGA
jgi:chemotaxis methyl-accepting protein methylase